MLSENTIQKYKYPVLYHLFNTDINIKRKYSKNINNGYILTLFSLLLFSSATFKNIFSKLITNEYKLLL